MLAHSIATEHEIRTAFGDKIKNKPEVVDRLLSIAQTYRLSADKLATKWEAMALAEGIDVFALEPKYLTVMQTQIKNDQNSANSLTSTAKATGFLSKKVHKNAKIIDITADNLDFLMMDANPVIENKKTTSSTTPHKIAKAYDSTSFLAKTPTQKFKSDFQDSPFVSSSPLAAKFSDRITKFKKEGILNDHIPFERAGVALNSTISVLPGQQLSGYRYMYEKVTRKGDALDDRITHFEPIILDYIKQQENNEDDIFLSDPTCAHHDSFYAVGRVCCDSLENAKFNEKSVMLEVSKAMGVGCRVMLILQDVFLIDSAVTLFPGQIIGIKGMNPSGREVIVSKIYSPPMLPLVSTPVPKLIEFYNQINPAKPVDVVILSGPYCLDDSLGFEPFEETVSHFIETEVPDIIVLTGPFVDQNHPLIQSGDIDVFPNELFKLNISSRLKRLLSFKSSVQFILIPSARDVCLEWVCFPQPPLCSSLSVEGSKEKKRQLGLDMVNVHLFPNPVQFRVNEVLFAVSTTDILFHMNTTSFIKPLSTEKPNRVKSLAKSILEQRHFYPLFPAKPGTYLELCRPAEMCLQASPDVLVLPCCLQAQCSTIDGVIWVNPGPLARRQNGGSFLRMCVHPLDIDALSNEMDASVLGHVADRCRVDLYKV